MFWNRCVTLIIAIVSSRLLLFANCSRPHHDYHASVEELFEPDAEIEALKQSRISPQHFRRTVDNANLESARTHHHNKPSHVHPALEKARPPEIGSKFQGAVDEVPVVSVPRQPLLSVKSSKPPHDTLQPSPPKANPRYTHTVDVKFQPEDDVPAAVVVENENHKELPIIPEAVEHVQEVVAASDGPHLPPTPVALRQSIQDSVSMFRSSDSEASIADVYFLAVVAGCTVAAFSGLVLAGVCWYRLHKKVKDTSDVEYPAYGNTGPAKERVGSPGDRKLAQSAQMYHYQHQKQQMIASEGVNNDVNNHGGAGAGGSDVESEEEGDYTVFECPGLATGGEMEVRNPLFNDQTPVTTPAENK